MTKVSGFLMPFSFFSQQGSILFSKFVSHVEFKSMTSWLVMAAKISSYTLIHQCCNLKKKAARITISSHNLNRYQFFWSLMSQSCQSAFKLELSFSRKTSRKRDVFDFSTFSKLSYSDMEISLNNVFLKDTREQAA